MKIEFKIKSQDELKKLRGLQKAGKVQKYIDSEVIRLSDKYVPFRTGNLKKSGITGTKTGSGLVVYNAPYAHKQYYHNPGKGKQGMNKTKGKKGLRGKFWFERMKNAHLDEIIEGAKKKAGVD